MGGGGGGGRRGDGLYVAIPTLIMTLHMYVDDGGAVTNFMVVIILVIAV